MILNTDTKHRGTETQSFLFSCPIVHRVNSPSLVCGEAANSVPPVIFPTDSYRTLWLCVSVFDIN